MDHLTVSTRGLSQYGVIWRGKTVSCKTSGSFLIFSFPSVRLDEIGIVKEVKRSAGLSPVAMFVNEKLYITS